MKISTFVSTLFIHADVVYLPSGSYINAALLIYAVIRILSFLVNCNRPFIKIMLELAFIIIFVEA